jgi:hypothetical protein
MAKHWHIENVEYRVSYLMQSGEEKHFGWSDATLEGRSRAAVEWS